MVRTLLLLCLLSLAGVSAYAADAAVLYHMHPDIHNKTSLQRGAKLFANYCAGCHSMQYHRYSRSAQDLGLTHEQVSKGFMFMSDKIGDPMTIALRAEDADKWLGAVPPDLSVIARSRGADWIYSYLQTFYEDKSRSTTGVNNLTYPGTSMPHVLWELQGLQTLTPASGSDHGGDGADGAHAAAASLTLTTPGILSPSAYRSAVYDIVNFLVYVGEPAALQRHKWAPWVLLFLGLFAVLAYLLKKEFWKDVT